MSLRNRLVAGAVGRDNRIPCQRNDSTFLYQPSYHQIHILARIFQIHSGSLTILLQQKNTIRTLPVQYRSDVMRARVDLLKFLPLLS